jgi:hypothetical protein
MPMCSITGLLFYIKFFGVFTVLSTILKFINVLSDDLLKIHEIKDKFFYHKKH